MTSRQGEADDVDRSTRITIVDGVITVVVPELERPVSTDDDLVIDLRDHENATISTGNVLASRPGRLVQAYRSGMDAQAARRAPGARTPLGGHIDERA